jgi:iron complex transport system substrate-binding protein
MRRAHGWSVAGFIAAYLMLTPAAAVPRHVVSAFLCTDEYVFRLLPRERIAALSFLAADRNPVVSTIVDAVKGIPLVHASAEEILPRNPDAVVLYAGSEPRLQAQLRAAGVPVIEVDWANSLADVRRITLSLGRTFGEEARAQSLLAAMDRELATAGPTGPPLRTLIYEPNGYATSDGVTGAMLKSAGLVDVAGRLGMLRDRTIPLEMVVASPPQLLVLNSADQRRPSLANLVLHHPALAALTAHTKIAHVSLTPLLCPGPWSADIVPQLVDAGQQARALARLQARP